ncbi:hypothetical protein AMJ85_05615 [candidate division BRC1 bacterium SM23_51]|nr:MAG: hypothetical protein AMJ85_05615 [candidate division BRC1 bacterium SM23_51]
MNKQLGHIGQGRSAGEPTGRHGVGWESPRAEFAKTLRLSASPESQAAVGACVAFAPQQEV